MYGRMVSEVEYFSRGKGRLIIQCRTEIFGSIMGHYHSPPPKTSILLSPPPQTSILLSPPPQNFDPPIPRSPKSYITGPNRARPAGRPSQRLWKIISSASVIFQLLSVPCVYDCARPTFPAHHLHLSTSSCTVSGHLSDQVRTTTTAMQIALLPHPPSLPSTAHPENSLNNNKSKYTHYQSDEHDGNRSRGHRTLDKNFKLSQ